MSYRPPRCDEALDGVIHLTPGPDPLEYGFACPEPWVARFEYAGHLAAYNRPGGPYLHLCDRHATIYRTQHADHYQEVGA